jgi:integrase
MAAQRAHCPGLRTCDLLRLCWSHVGTDSIVISTGKSRHQREAIIPLYDRLRDILARIPKRSTTILTNSMGHPWTDDGFGGRINDAKKAAGLERLHFHDLRGTAATRFYTAGGRVILMLGVAPHCAIKGPGHR